MKNTKTIIITGTHHTPAIELIRLLRQDSQTTWKIFYIGHQTTSQTHLIHTIIPQLKIKFYHLNCGKFDRNNLLKSCLGTFSTINAFFRSLSLLNRIKPDLVVSFGGYISVPVIMAAYFKKIPSITHEQTTIFGLSTKINSYFVNKIALSFNNPHHLPKNKVVITGNLIRQAIFVNQSSRYQKLISNHKPIIYITGGNQGSAFINNLIINLIPKLKNQYHLIHQTGENFPIHHFANYFPTHYVGSEDIGWVLHHAQIIISRAGANICQEIDALCRPAILIPLPFAQQNEQLLNAQWLYQHHQKSVIIIPQSKANTSNLLKAIQQLSSLPNSPPPATKSSPNLKFLKLIHELT